MGRYTAAATEAQKWAMIDAIVGMKAQIPEILDVHAGQDLSLAEGNHGFVAMVDFANSEHYKAYAKHPAHQAVIANYIKPILEPGTRTAVQFAL